MAKHSKLLSGILAFTVYFTLLGLLINYFNHHTSHKSIHYVKKSENRIMVSLSSPSKENRTPQHSKQAVKKKAKTKSREKPKVIKSVEKRQVEKSPPKKSRPDKKEERSNKKKKVDINNLFKKVKEKQPLHKETRKKRRMSGRERKSMDKGIQNPYFAKVENMLQSWPAQSEFAGENIRVWLRIQQDGSFSFRVLSASGNDAFNTALIQFLKQLQQIGFGRHQNSRPYELNVEFVAKE